MRARGARARRHRQAVADIRGEPDGHELGDLGAGRGEREGIDRVGLAEVPDLEHTVGQEAGSAGATEHGIGRDQGVGRGAHLERPEILGREPGRAQRVAGEIEEAAVGDRHLVPAGQEIHVPGRMGAVLHLDVAVRDPARDQLSTEDVAGELGEPDVVGRSGEGDRVPDAEGIDPDAARQDLDGAGHDVGERVRVDVGAGVGDPQRIADPDGAADGHAARGGAEVDGLEARAERSGGLHPDGVAQRRGEAMRPGLDERPGARRGPDHLEKGPRPDAARGVVPFAAVALEGGDPGHHQGVERIGHHQVGAVRHREVGIHREGPPVKGEAAGAEHRGVPCGHRGIEHRIPVDEQVLVRRGGDVAGQTVVVGVGDGEGRARGKCDALTQRKEVERQGALRIGVEVAQGRERAPGTIERA